MNIVIRIFAVIICSIIFISAIYAQEKPQALKFDEFEEPSESSFTSYSDELTLMQRAERFGRQLRKERGAKAYIICYLGRITENDAARRISYKIYELKLKIRAENGYSIDNIVTINGGYREKTTIEFWIAPKGAEPPQPTPTLDKSAVTVCPRINVYSRNLLDQPGFMDFVFNESDLKEIPNVALTWKFTGGEIVNEQGLSEIRIKVNDNVKRVTAFLEVEGLPYPCPKVFSTSAAVNGKLYLTDDFGHVTNEEILARLDGFIGTVYENPKAKAYIIIYGNRATGRRDLVRLERLIRNQLLFRRVDTSRITFINGGYRETEATELWLSFDEKEKPVPTPTVDAKFVGIPAAKKSKRR